MYLKFSSTVPTRTDLNAITYSRHTCNGSVLTTNNVGTGWCWLSQFTGCYVQILCDCNDEDEPKLMFNAYDNDNTCGGQQAIPTASVSVSDGCSSFGYTCANGNIEGTIFVSEQEVENCCPCDGDEFESDED